MVDNFRVIASRINNEVMEELPGIFRLFNRLQGSVDFKEFKLKHWNEYEKYLAYPIDFDDGDDLPGLINRAVKEEQSEWKRLFIGDKMSSVYLSKLLKNIRNGKEE